MTDPLTRPAPPAAADSRIALRGRLGSFELDVAFDLPTQGTTGLFGPSGCGKTTVLRAIAGLQPLAGTVAIAGDVWQDERRTIPPHRRAVGYVFQEASLFAHLTVAGNLRFGMAGRDASLFDDVVDMLSLRALLDRAPARLSGGERQRVALGRALISRPRILLADEPLAALDARAKEEILPFLAEVQSRLAIPILYVSHDLAEIERLADHIVVMEAGRVVASGRLTQVQGDPDLPLARLRGAAVSIDCTLGDDGGDGLMRLHVRGGTLLVPARPTQRAGRYQRVRIAAADVSLARTAATDSSVLNILPARLLSLTAVGDHEVIAALALGRDGTGDRLLARISRHSRDHLRLQPGETIHAQIKGVALVG